MSDRIGHLQLGVGQKKAAELANRMEAAGVRETDIDETFILGGGPGGQKVNKTASTVRLTHRPTGVTVTAGSERSQALNRFLARRRLVEALAGDDSAAQQRERIRRRKSKRRRRARDKY